MKKRTLVYALHSGSLYGTERMALATAIGLRDDFDTIFFAPAGEALVEANKLGFKTQSFSSPIKFALQLRPLLASNNELAFVATGLIHSIALIVWNLWYRRRVTHLHIVHGGAEELLSYGRKRKLNRFGVTIVAVSEFVRSRLIANGVRQEKIRIAENFLTNQRIFSCRRRPRFSKNGIQNVVVVSRVDPIKRVDLLLNALDQTPDLGQLSIRVLGTGWDLEQLRERARKNNPNVTFVGFTENVEQELASSDLLIHLCPNEPFGLAILEAMAAGIPVLVPNSGGAGALVEDGATGFHFEADNSSSLANKINSLLQLPPENLNDVVDQGRAALIARFSESKGIATYRQLLAGGRLS